MSTNRSVLSQPGRLPTRTFVALATPALPMAAMTLPLTIFLPAFYASVVGIDLGLVGFVFTVIRVADLFFAFFRDRLTTETRRPK